MCCKVKVLQSASVAKCKCCKVQVLQSASVAKCKWCKEQRCKKYKVGTDDRTDGGTGELLELLSQLIILSSLYYIGMT